MAVTSFIPELWSARLLHALDNSHVAANLVNRNYEGEIKQSGDTVHINTIGEIAVRNYEGSVTTDDLSTTDQTLKIDQKEYFSFKMKDVDAAQAAGDMMDSAMQRAGYALSDKSDKFLLKTIAAGANEGNKIGSAGSAIQLTAANIYEHIVKLRTALDKANVPTADRKLVVPPEVYALLLMDDRFVKASDGATANKTLLNGEVGSVAGFTVYMSNNVNWSSDHWEIVATVPYATTYAEQILQTEANRLTDDFADQVRGLHVYGAKVTEPKAVAVLYGKLTP